MNDKTLKKEVRFRMTLTGESYSTALRAVQAMSREEAWRLYGSHVRREAKKGAKP